MCFHGACFLLPDQATLFQNVEEALRDSIGPFLRVHVKLIVSTSPHMLAVGVGAVVGEPPPPFVTTALETSLPSDKDFFGDLRLISGSVKCFVGNGGKPCLGIVVISRAMFHYYHLLCFARVDQVLSGLHNGVRGGNGGRKIFIMVMMVARESFQHESRGWPGW